MGKRHAGSKGPRIDPKRAKYSVRNLGPEAKSPQRVIDEYILGPDHEDSSTSWIYRKLHRYYTNDSFTTFGDGERYARTEMYPMQSFSDESVTSYREPSCKVKLFDEGKASSRPPAAEVEGEPKSQPFEGEAKTLELNLSCKGPECGCDICLWDEGTSVQPSASPEI